MAHELFFQEKLSQCEVPYKQTTSVVNEAPRHSNVVFVQEILTSWFDSPLLESLIKLYSSMGYAKLDIFRAKVSTPKLIIDFHRGLHVLLVWFVTVIYTSLHLLLLIQNSLRKIE